MVWSQCNSHTFSTAYSPFSIVRAALVLSEKAFCRAALKLWYTHTRSQCIWSGRANVVACPLQRLNTLAKDSSKYGCWGLLAELRTSPATNREHTMRCLSATPPTCPAEPKLLRCSWKPRLADAQASDICDMPWAVPPSTNTLSSASARLRILAGQVHAALRSWGSCWEGPGEGSSEDAPACAGAEELACRGFVSRSSAARCAAAACGSRAKDSTACRACRWFCCRKAACLPCGKPARSAISCCEQPRLSDPGYLQAALQYTLDPVSWMICHTKACREQDQ